jgi:hypothetical protein
MTLLTIVADRFDTSLKGIEGILQFFKNRNIDIQFLSLTESNAELKVAQWCVRVEHDFKKIIHSENQALPFFLLEKEEGGKILWYSSRPDADDLRQAIDLHTP